MTIGKAVDYVTEDVKVIVETVFNVFYDLKGFDDWWDSLDEDIADEIMNELVEKLKQL